MLVEKVNTAKTPKEKAKLGTEKNKWRSKCRAFYGKDWTKRGSSRLHEGKRRMNTND